MNLSRRKMLIVMGASAMTALQSPSAISESANARTVDMLRDRRFQTGVNMLKADPTHRLNAGVLCANGKNCNPAWNGAQWYSHYNLGAASPERLSSGSIRYFDGAKAITFGKTSSPEADLILALNGRKEYNDIPPTGPAAWPHLLVSQQCVENPALPQIHSIPFQISYRLLQAVPHRGSGWDEKRHTAQFLFYVRVENFNRASPGFRDYYWFGVPMYDARYSTPITHEMADKGNAHKQGTGKFIYNLGGKTYAEKPAVNGEWITIGKDLLPLIQDGLEAAWNAGFLSGSHRKEDYHLGSMNVGWEVTGPWNVAMQVRNLNLQAVVTT